MRQNQFEALFSDSFDIFKVFNGLTAQEAGRNFSKAPKTICQILNHLIVWQDYQLKQLQSTETRAEISEQMTWPLEEQCDSQEELDKAVAKFNKLLEYIREELSKLDSNDAELQNKLKVVQDLSVHLSFHTGEVVLMRRITGTYPLPHQMKEFLS
jgi:septal ring factor EnvC (AmiA/AmiB activator)